MASRIESVGAFLPPTIVSSLEVESRLDLDRKSGWIEELTSVHSRRNVPEGTAASDLAVAAIADALARSKYTASDLDLIVLGSIASDVMEPASSNIVQTKLGATAACLDVKNACNGWLNALQVADALMRTGQYKCAAVAAGEYITLNIPWHLARDSNEPFEFLGALTLGDGGGAVILEPAETSDGIVAMEFFTDGSLWEAATVMGGGSIYPRDPERHFFLSDARPLYSASADHVPQLLSKTLERAGWSAAEVDLIVPHQVSRRMLEEFCRDYFDSGIEISSFVFPQYGNCGAASIPIALDAARQEGRLKPGTKVLLAGAGAGFTLAFGALVA